MMSARSSVVFHVNSRRFEVTGRDCLRTLADFLRRDLALPGTKVVCAEGDCGACTVLAGFAHEAEDGRLRYRAVNSCILPLYSLDACHVITVEGLKADGRLHPVQKALVDHHATQCGYCTPGFACALTALAQDAHAAGDEAISEKKARNGLTGNLCRCTGYDAILKAAQAVPLTAAHDLARGWHDDARMAEFAGLCARSVAIESGGVGVFIPATLEEALRLKKSVPGLKIVGGATDTGVLVNKGVEKPVQVMSLAHIQELRRLSKDGGWAEVGAAVTLNALESFAHAEIPELGRLLHVFASPQIKNRATLAGNVVNASPIGDLIPFLLVSDAELELQGAGGARRVALDAFYRGYRKVDLRADELVAGVRLRLSAPGSQIRLYKASGRKDLDISAVAFAARLELDGRVIKSARLAFGGVAPTVIRLKQLEARWTGAEFTRELVAAAELPPEVAPISDVRGSKEFRLRLCRNLLLKFADETLAGLAS